MGNICLRLRKSFQPFDLRERTITAKVLSVYDGDTITIGFKFRGNYWKSSLRIYGIDTPELKPRRQGRTEESIIQEKEAAEKARDYLSGRILGKLITVKFNKLNDKYGRLLGEVFLGRENLVETMIGLGMGYEYGGGKKREI
jgi:endonuclease YncB( thermonuclease family)